MERETGRRHRLSAEEKDKILDLYKHNVPVRVIAGEMSVDQMTVRNIAKKAGVYNPRPVGGHAKTNQELRHKRAGKSDRTIVATYTSDEKKQLNDLDKKVIVDLFNYGSTVKDIANIVKFSAEGVRKFLIREGFISNPKYASEISEEFTIGDYYMGLVGKKTEPVKEPYNELLQLLSGSIIANAEETKKVESDSDKKKDTKKSENKVEVKEPSTDSTSGKSVDTPTEKSTKKIEFLGSVNRLGKKRGRKPKVDEKVVSRKSASTTGAKNETIKKASAKDNKPKVEKSQPAKTKKKVCKSKVVGGVSKQEKIDYCNMIYGKGNWKFMTRDELLEELRKALG